MKNNNAVVVQGSTVQTNEQMAVSNPTPPLQFIECKSSSETKIFRHTINTFHSYMDYKDTCNRRINWNVYETSTGNLVGALGINSAILSIQARDSWIGWNTVTKRLHLNKLANNYRFAIIRENVTVPNIGSQMLKALRYIGPIAWKTRYGDELVLLETLVKPPWTGAVYRADNWIYVGMTKGVSFSKAPLLSWQKEKSARGELARSNPKAAILKYAVGRTHYCITQSEPKLVFLKPLCKYWRKKLGLQ